MTLIYKNRNLLREDAPADGGGGGTTPPANKVTQMKASPSSGVPHPSKAVPANIASTTFSVVDDFEVEQLPTKVMTEDNSGKATAIEPSTETSSEPKEKVAKPEVKEKAKEETKKEEPAPLLKPPTEKPLAIGKGKEDIKAIGLPDKKEARDYTGFAPEEVNALKQMSNEGYALTSKLIKDNRELKKLEGTTYLQHENAYVLDPQFQELQLDATYAKKEGDYWKSQLIAMDGGKNWKPIVKWDVNGNPVLGAEQPGSKAAELEVARMMNNAYGVVQSTQGKLAEYPTKYKTYIKEALKDVDNECKQRFSWEADPKLLDYTISIAYQDGSRDVSIKDIKKEFSELFPAPLRAHPAVNVAANLMVALRVGQAQMAANTGTAAVTEIKKEEQQLGEPASTARPAKPGKETHGVTKFEIDPSIM